MLRDPGGGWPLGGKLDHLVSPSQAPLGTSVGTGPTRRSTTERVLSAQLDVPRGAPAPLGRVRPRQAMVRQPMTDRVWPVMYPAASEARKATAGAMSSGIPSRRIGTALVIDSITRSASAPASMMPWSIGVSVGPGHTALAVTPYRATSRAIVLVKA